MCRKYLEYVFFLSQYRLHKLTYFIIKQLISNVILRAIKKRLKKAVTNENVDSNHNQRYLDINVELDNYRVDSTCMPTLRALKERRYLQLYIEDMNLPPNIKNGTLDRGYFMLHNLNYYDPN